jgi:hypothetical protein
MGSQVSAPSIGMNRSLTCQLVGSVAETNRVLVERWRAIPKEDRPAIIADLQKKIYLEDAADAKEALESSAEREKYVSEYAAMLSGQVCGSCNEGVYHSPHVLELQGECSHRRLSPGPCRLTLNFRTSACEHRLHVKFSRLRNLEAA